MTEREEWLIWINDQMKDMYNDDSYTKVTNLNNRVFKTLQDDREVAMMLLSTLKQIMENNPKT